MGFLAPMVPVVVGGMAMTGAASIGSPLALASLHQIEKKEKRQERRKDRRKAHAAAEENKRRRGELAKFHAQRYKGGGGPGAPIVTAGQIQQGVGRIREGATAKEVLG